MNYLTLNAAAVKQEAKNLKIKNWWKLDKQSLLCDIAATMGWKSEDGIGTRDYLLAGNEVHVIESAPVPAPIPARSDCAGGKVEPKKPRKVKKLKGEPTEAAKAKAEKKPKSKGPSLPVGWVTLATLCKEHDIKPVVARRRLRKANQTKNDTYGWSWEAPATEIIAIIKG